MDRVTERSVEVPWVAANAPRRADAALDIGAANALYHDHIRADLFVRLDLRMPRREEEQTVGLLANTTAIPFPDETFDLITCISTIEHIGQRSTGYGTTKQPGHRELAIAEMRRVLRKHGLLLVTAPFGQAEDLGWQVVFDERSWNALWPTSDWLRWEVFYVLGGGCRYLPCSPDDLRGVRYDRRNVRAGGVVCSRICKQVEDAP